MRILSLVAAGVLAVDASAAVELPRAAALETASAPKIGDIVGPALSLPAATAIVPVDAAPAEATPVGAPFDGAAAIADFHDDLIDGVEPGAAIEEGRWNAVGAARGWSAAQTAAAVRELVEDRRLVPLSRSRVAHVHSAHLKDDAASAAHSLLEARLSEGGARAGHLGAALVHLHRRLVAPEENSDAAMDRLFVHAAEELSRALVALLPDPQPMHQKVDPTLHDVAARPFADLTLGERETLLSALPRMERVLGPAVPDARPGLDRLGAFLAAGALPTPYRPQEIPPWLPLEITERENMLTPGVEAPQESVALDHDMGHLAYALVHQYRGGWSVLAPRLTDGDDVTPDSAVLVHTRSSITNGYLHLAPTAPRTVRIVDVEPATIPGGSPMVRIEEIPSGPRNHARLVQLAALTFAAAEKADLFEPEMMDAWGRGDYAEFLWEVARSWSHDENGRLNRDLLGELLALGSDEKRLEVLLFQISGALDEPHPTRLH